MAGSLLSQACQDRRETLAWLRGMARKIETGAQLAELDGARLAGALRAIADGDHDAFSLRPRAGQRKVETLLKSAERDALLQCLAHKFGTSQNSAARMIAREWSVFAQSAAGRSAALPTDPHRQELWLLCRLSRPLRPESIRRILGKTWPLFLPSHLRESGAIRYPAAPLQSHRRKGTGGPTTGLAAPFANRLNWSCQWPTRLPSPDHSRTTM
jgi:hypothetical protein